MSEKEIFVTKPTMPSLEEYMQALRPVWESSILTNCGVMHERFAGELSEYLGADMLELFVNGHMALDVAVKVLGIKGEVITTPFTFASTAHAITLNGLTPVFCDIRPDTFNIDESKIEALINENTSAIMPVHVYGIPCDFEKIRSIAEKHGLKVIYDAAHAFGVTVGGKSVACEGDITMYSFHATKVFNTAEGGALAFGDYRLRRKILDLMNFGIEGPNAVVTPGMNGKMNELCAALGLCNLKHIEQDISARRDIAMHYMDRLSGCAGIKSADFTSLENSEIRLNFGYFPILVEREKAGFSRDELSVVLDAQGIHARKYFWPLVTDYECYRERYGECEIPVARKIAAEVLTLPIYPGLEIADVDRICAVICNMQAVG